jgi:hypothetical protein
MSAIPQNAKEFAAQMKRPSYGGSGVAEHSNVPGSKTETLTERMTISAGTKVDRERGVIPSVKVLGRISKNGREYTAEAIGKGARLYENAPVNIDHAKPASAERSYRDRIGHLANVQQRGGELFADLHYNPKHQLAEQLAWDAEHSPGNVGLSHNVTARTVTKGGKVVVESIERVVSVDLVADPATTNGLYESKTPDKKHVQSVADAETIVSDYSDWLLLAANTPGVAKGAIKSKFEELLRDFATKIRKFDDAAIFANATSGERATGMGGAATESIVRNMIFAAGLSESIIPPTTRQQIAEAVRAGKTDFARRAVADIAKVTGCGGPPTVQSFVARLRRSY